MRREAEAKVLPASPAWTSTAGLLRQAAQDFGSRDAICDERGALSYADLSHEIDLAGTAFVVAGLVPGSRFAIWAGNRREWIVAAIAGQAAGGILVPINTRFKGDEAVDILARSGAEMLFTVGSFLGSDYPAMLREAAGNGMARLPALRHIILFDEGWTGFLASAQDAPSALSEREALETGDGVSDIIFTSGTTGRPKGAMLRHGQTRRAIEGVREIMGLRASDRYVVVPPFFNTFGYRYGFMLALLSGATAVLRQSFDLRAFPELCVCERINFVAGPPTLFHALLDAPDRERFDLSTLRIALLGGATIPVSLIERMRTELTFETIITAYGLTENTGLGAICRQGDTDAVIAGTAGRPFPGTELRIADEHGNALSAGGTGEIWIRGFAVMKGYLDDPDGTAAAIDGEGWLHTGDIGVQDEAGNLRIVDRMKDLFIVGGFNAYPAEIENVLLRHPAIAQAAVVGMPDDRLGEVGAAFVTLHGGATLEPDVLIAWCRASMANYKVPRLVEIVDTLPVNASGKVQKFTLRDLAAQHAGKANAQPTHAMMRG